MEPNNTPGAGQPVVTADPAPALPVDVTKTPAPVAEALTLEEINLALGKSFPDKETAIKALKDNNSFVGKKKEDVAASLVGTGDYISKKELDTEFLYKENAVAAQHRTLIDSFAKANNLTSREALERPEIKTLLEKAKNFDASQSHKSVIETNPKLGQIKNSAQEVNTLVQNGDKDAAGIKAAKTVLEALGA